MAGSFHGDIQAFTEKVQHRGDVILRKVALDLFRGVVMKTPVDTGRARGNWMVGINRIPTETQLGIENAPMTRIISDVSAARWGDSVALANSVAYIGVLEYGGFPNPPIKGSKTEGGYSKQAPQGMVRITIEQYRPTLNKVVALVKRETP